MQEKSGGLIRGLRRWDMVALVLNAVIGAGIFGLPARIQAQVGNYSLLAYLVCAVLIMLIILCFAEVASRFKDTGGPYLYAREAFGPVVGFQMGWLLWLARVTAFAALMNLFIDYLAEFWPAAGAGFWRSVVVVLMVGTLVGVNIRGVRSSAFVINVFTVGKLVPLVLLVTIGLFFVDTSRFTFAEAPGLGSFSGAVLLAVFAFSGFETAVIPAGETSDPQKNTPFALIIGISIIVLLYILLQIVSIGTVPDLAQSQRPLADAGSRILGSTGAKIIISGALVSITGTLNSVSLAASRLLYALAENRQLPSVFAATHARFRSPHISVIVSGVVMLVLTLRGSFITALTISTVIRLITYALTCLALPVLRRRHDAPVAAFRVPGGPAVTVAALLLCAWVLASVGPKDIRDTAIAAAAGMILFAIARIGARKAAA